MRVLFLTHRLPVPPDRGDRIRAYQLLRHLHSYAEVDLVSLVHSDAEEAAAKTLDGLVASVHALRVPRARNLVRGALRLATAVPLTHLLLDSPSMRGVLDGVVAAHRPDIVVAFCSGMARFAIEPPLADLPLVIDMVDVDSRKWHELGQRRRRPMRWIYGREAHVLSRFEALVARRAYASMVVNERERDELVKLAPDARVHVVPIGMDVDYLVPPRPPAPSADVVFCGVMNYSLNVEGAIWMARRIWPLVRRRHPFARLRIVGADPTATVRALHDVANGIEVTGRVPDVRPYLWSAAVATAPLPHARGVQTKVLEAVCAGLPCVVTPAVAAGLPTEVLGACTVAATPEEFAAGVVRGLSQTPDARRAVTATVDLNSMTWDRRLAPFRSILEAAARNHASNHSRAGAGADDVAYEIRRGREARVAEQLR